MPQNKLCPPQNTVTEHLYTENHKTLVGENRGLNGGKHATHLLRGQRQGHLRIQHDFHPVPTRCCAEMRNPVFKVR